MLLDRTLCQYAAEWGYCARIYPHLRPIFGHLPCQPQLRAALVFLIQYLINE
jgi:hypothetical protein